MLAVEETTTEERTKNKVKVIEKIYRFLQQARAKEVVVYGGAGSGKSYTVHSSLSLISFCLNVTSTYSLQGSITRV